MHMYKKILRPVWIYGIQLWGCTKKTNIKVIITFRKVVRSIVNAPWYVRNDDLKIESVSEVIIQLYAAKHEQWLHDHNNPEDVYRLLDHRFPNCGTRTPGGYVRRCQGVREQNCASLLDAPAVRGKFWVACLNLGEKFI